MGMIPLGPAWDSKTPKRPYPCMTTPTWPCTGVWRGGGAKMQAQNACKTVWAGPPHPSRDSERGLLLSSLQFCIGLLPQSCHLATWTAGESHLCIPVPVISFDIISKLRAGRNQSPSRAIGNLVSSTGFPHGIGLPVSMNSHIAGFQHSTHQSLPDEQVAGFQHPSTPLSPAPMNRWRGFRTPALHSVLPR